MNDLSQVVALLRKLTHTDGKESLEESRWLRRLVSELPSETETDEEFDPEKLKSLADGQTTADEWKLIQQTARLLEYPDDKLETLRSETVLLKDPY